MTYECIAVCNRIIRSMTEIRPAETRTLKFLRFSAAVTVMSNAILHLRNLLKRMSEHSYHDIWYLKTKKQCKQCEITFGKIGVEEIVAIIEMNVNEQESLRVLILLQCITYSVVHGYCHVTTWLWADLWQMDGVR